MGEKKVARPEWWPEWYNGKSVMEPAFCQAFLAKYPLACIENSFFSANGKVTNESVMRSVIYRMVQPFVTSAVSKKVDDIMKALRMEAAIEELPPQTDRIHVQNGTLFLDGTFTEEKKEVVRSRFPVRYNPEAKPPERWLQFLSDLLWPEDIPTLQEFIGYCLIPTNAGQKMMLIKGNGGEGKSQIGHVLSCLLGSNMKDGSISKVTENQFARADLEYIHLMVDDDMRLEALKQTSYIKSIVTAKGKMDLERKGKQSYQGYMYARILAFSNGDLVSLYDRSDGFFRRQLILTTKRRPQNRVDDPNLSDKLCKELEGIFLWAFEGLRRLVKNNFRFTESDRARLNWEIAKKDANNIELFMESEGYIMRDEKLMITSRQLAQIYETWCDENAYPAMKSKTLIEHLNANKERYGIEYTNLTTNSAGRRVRGFKGIGPALRPTEMVTGGWQIVDPEDNPFKNA